MSRKGVRDANKRISLALKRRQRGGMAGLRTWALERLWIGRKEKSPAEKNLSIPGNSKSKIQRQGKSSSSFGAGRVMNVRARPIRL